MMVHKTEICTAPPLVHIVHSNSVYSVPIFHIHIALIRLLRMAAVAQRSPVALIPEQLRITAMGNHVVNVRCLDVPAFLHALFAERMGKEEPLPCLLPLVPVATGGRGAALLFLKVPVLLTILLSPFHEVRAPWGSAWLLRCLRHPYHSFPGKRKAPRILSRRSCFSTIPLYHRWM